MRDSRTDTQIPARRVLFMGTPEFAVPSLLALHQAQTRDSSCLIGVATQPDRPAGRKRQLTPSPVKTAAQTLNLPILQPERLRKNPQAVQAIAELAPDVIVVAAYGLILPKAVLEIPRYGCINVHASLLPAYRGASPITAALLDGRSETGISIMLMDEGLDTGPVLAQRALAIAPDDTSGTLTARLAQLGAILLIDTLTEYLAGSIAPTDQSQLAGQVSLCGLIRKEDGRIDWATGARHIERMTRAYSPWPGAYTVWQGEPFKIIRAETSATGPTDSEPVAPGTIVAWPDDGKLSAAVQTGAGLLHLRQVQPAGKRSMDIQTFLNGAPGFIGSVLA